MGVLQEGRPMTRPFRGLQAVAVVAAAGVVLAEAALPGVVDRLGTVEGHRSVGVLRIRQ
jgi:hypothetical protein